MRRFISGIIPGIESFYINFRIGIYRLNTQSESVNAAGAFRNGSSESGNVTYFIAGSGKSCYDTGKITGLVNSAEIIVHVVVFAFSESIEVTGAMGEYDVGIFFSVSLKLFHITETGSDNHIAALFDKFFYRGINRGRIAVVNTVFNDNLRVFESEFGLHSFDTLLMSISIARRGANGIDVQYADFEFFSRIIVFAAGKACKTGTGKNYCEH